MAQLLFVGTPWYASSLGALAAAVVPRAHLFSAPPLVFLPPSHFVGTPQGYIDPEYAATYTPTERSDVYAFGVVLLELATGWRPIGGPEKKHIIQRVRHGQS